MLWPSRKKMTAKTTTNRNCPIPNEGGFGPDVFNELAIDLILTTRVKLALFDSGGRATHRNVAHSTGLWRLVGLQGRQGDERRTTRWVLRRVHRDT
jgi:hypothetical protein